MECLGSLCTHGSVQYVSRGRTVVPWDITTPHGGGLWQRGLGDKWTLVWSLSSLRTVEDPRCCHLGDGVLCSPEPILSQHLVCSHCSFRAKCFLYCPALRAGASMVVKQASSHLLYPSQARFRDGNNI